MSSKNIPILVVLFVTILGVSLHFWYLPQLPDRIATHFGMNGEPNEWMSKTNATLLLAGIQVGLPLFLLGVGLLIPKVPNSMINIPNRDYWLQPERRVASLGRVSTMLAWIAVLVSVEMLAVIHLTFLANKSDEDLNTSLLVGILVGFLAAVFCLVGKNMWHFRRPKTP